MKTLVTISAYKGDRASAIEILELVNTLLCTPAPKDIAIYDLTRKGLHPDLKSFVRSYNKYGVFIVPVKRAKKTDDLNARINLGLAESLLAFNNVSSNKYDTYVHLYKNMSITSHDFLTLINNAQLYNAVSPVIDTVDGIEILSAVFDRWGVEYYPMEQSATHFVSGQVEDSFVLNPKCFAMSKRYAGRLRDFTYSHREPVDYLNDLIYRSSSKMPRVDTNIMVHENIY
jgi:hypothetical protein